MSITLKHATQASGSDAGTGEIRKAQWNEAHTFTISADRILGRTTSGEGAVEELTVGTGLTLSGGSLSVTSSTYQPLDATLTALASVSTSADTVIYATASDTFSTATLTSFARTLLDDTDAATARATLGLSGTGAGTVTSVDVSGGTTGLTTSGGAITSSGTITIAGTLAATNGGTGQTSFAVGDLLYASTTTALSKLADVATGNALISGGVGVAPSWGKVGLTTHVSGILPVANGGTNNAYFTISGPATAAKTYTFPNADCTILTTNAAVSVAQGGTGQTSYTDGQLLIGNSSGNTLAKATLTAGNGIAVTNGGGTISLAVDAATDAQFQAATANKVITAGILNTANAPESSSGGTAWTPDFDTARVFSRTITASQAINNPSNPREGQSGLIYITQTGTGAYDITSWGSSYDWPNGAPTLDTGQNKINCISYYVRTTTSITCVYLGSHA